MYVFGISFQLYILSGVRRAFAPEAWHWWCSAIGTAQSVSLTIANWYQFMTDIQMSRCVRVCHCRAHRHTWRMCVELNSPIHWAKQNHWNCHCLCSQPLCLSLSLSARRSTDRLRVREREIERAREVKVDAVWSEILTHMLYWALGPCYRTVIGLARTHKLCV